MYDRRAITTIKVTRLTAQKQMTVWNVGGVWNTALETTIVASKNGIGHWENTKPFAIIEWIP